jgi:hypothetical protein
VESPLPFVWNGKILEDASLEVSVASGIAPSKKLTEEDSGTLIYQNSKAIL